MVRGDEAVVRGQPAGRMASSGDRVVDVVIATRNRPDALRRCLAALERQTLHDVGVIVVDDGSEPPVAPVVAEFARLMATVVRHDTPRGPAAARNRGVEEVAARYVAFVDDDIVVEPDFLAQHLAAVTAEHDADVAIVSCGPFVEPPDWDPSPWTDWEAHQLRKASTALLSGQYAVTWRQFHTGNNCLPTDRFRELGGFDESFLRGEDDELAYRLHRSGCRFVFVPEAVAWHYAVRSLEAWLAIPRAYARFEYRFDQLHPEANHLAIKKAELARRSVVLRVARRLAAGPKRTALAVRGSVGAARLFHRIGWRWPAFGALSVAYDLSYVDGLREAGAGEAS